MSSFEEEIELWKTRAINVRLALKEEKEKNEKEKNEIILEYENEKNKLNEKILLLSNDNSLQKSNIETNEINKLNQIIIELKKEIENIEKNTNIKENTFLNDINIWKTRAIKIRTEYNQLKSEYDIQKNNYNDEINHFKNIINSRNDDVTKEKEKEDIVKQKQMEKEKYGQELANIKSQMELEYENKCKILEKQLEIRNKHINLENNKLMENKYQNNLKALSNIFQEKKNELNKNLKDSKDFILKQNEEFKLEYARIYNHLYKIIIVYEEMSKNQSTLRSNSNSDFETKLKTEEFRKKISELSEQIENGKKEINLWKTRAKKVRADLLELQQKQSLEIESRNELFKQQEILIIEKLEQRHKLEVNELKEEIEKLKDDLIENESNLKKYLIVEVEKENLNKNSLLSINNQIMQNDQTQKEQENEKYMNIQIIEEFKYKLQDLMTSMEKQKMNFEEEKANLEEKNKAYISDLIKKQQISINEKNLMYEKLLDEYNLMEQKLTTEHEKHKSNLQIWEGRYNDLDKEYYNIKVSHEEMVENESSLVKRFNEEIEEIKQKYENQIFTMKEDTSNSILNYEKQIASFKHDNGLLQASLDNMVRDFNILNNNKFETDEQKRNNLICLQKLQSFQKILHDYSDKCLIEMSERFVEYNNKLQTIERKITIIQNSWKNKQNLFQTIIKGYETQIITMKNNYETKSSTLATTFQLNFEKEKEVYKKEIEELTNVNNTLQQNLSQIESVHMEKINALNNDFINKENQLRQNLQVELKQKYTNQTFEDEKKLKSIINSYEDKINELEEIVKFEKQNLVNKNEMEIQSMKLQNEMKQYEEKIKNLELIYDEETKKYELTEKKYIERLNYQMENIEKIKTELEIIMKERDNHEQEANLWKSRATKVRSELKQLQVKNDEDTKRLIAENHLYEQKIEKIQENFNKTIKDINEEHDRTVNGLKDELSTKNKQISEMNMKLQMYENKNHADIESKHNFESELKILKTERELLIDKLKEVEKEFDVFRRRANVAVKRVEKRSEQLGPLDALLKDTQKQLESLQISYKIYQNETTISIQELQFELKEINNKYNNVIYMSYEDRESSKYK